jgi:hypothetical protein
MIEGQNALEGNDRIPFPTFCWRTIAVYMIAYAIAGVIAQIYYRPIWDSGAISAIMKPMNSPMVALGPMLQCVNAFFISLIIFPFRSSIIDQKNGWAKLFLLIGGFSIFVPQAPAPGSFEGFIYTKLTPFEHLIGLPETLLFSLLFSLGITQWHKKPKDLWNIVSILLVSLIVLMSTLGYLSAIGIIRRP